MSEHTPSRADGEPEADEVRDDQPPRTAPARAQDTRARRGGKPGLSLHLREEPKTPIHEEFDR
ncbi:hypothetical protein ACGFT2_02125 [Streptomyces sp. NPDC048514]|uniref:hypothetical protein n=1 Tax=Streptomyces sp. NPDC048514 TaxID=3365564 RepID=UPI003714AC11